MAVPAAARALAAAGEGVTRGHRVPTVRQGQGQAAWTARRATAVVGSTGLPTAEPSGSAAHGRPHQRRDGAAHPLPAVGVRQGQGQAEGPGGHPVCPPQAAGAKPRQPGAAADDRRRLEPGWIRAAPPPGDVPHPPPQTARAGRGPGLFTRRLCALAPAYRRPGARAALGGEPGGGQRWRRQLREPNRDQVSGGAQGPAGLLPRAGFALLLGATRKAVPPELGTRRDILAKDDLPPTGCSLYWNLRLYL